MRDSYVGDGPLFQPDILTPSQYFAAARRKVTLGPEYRLVVAVLEDAVECYQKHWNARDLKGRKLFEDAQEWIASPDRQWPYSFENICELLGLNPEILRRGLLAWREEHERSRQSASASASADDLGKLSA